MFVIITGPRKTSHLLCKSITLPSSSFSVSEVLTQYSNDNDDDDDTSTRSASTNVTGKNDGLDPAKKQRLGEYAALVNEVASLCMT